jgi:hypothetical protein
VAPIAIIGISLLHIWLFVPNISVGRAIGYGVFWGAMLTFALVGATRSERARRLHGQAAARKAAEKATESESDERIPPSA